MAVPYARYDQAHEELQATLLPMQGSRIICYIYYKKLMRVSGRECT